MTLTKNASNTSDGFADVFGLAFAVRRGAVPALDAGEYIAGAALAPGDDDASVLITNAEPGVFYVAARADGPSPLVGASLANALTADPGETNAFGQKLSFDAYLELEASSSPNAFNGCAHGDDRLVVEIAVSATSGNETSRRYEWLGPSPVDDTGVEGAPLPGIPSAGLADVYEPAYGACGAFVASPNGASPSNKTLRTCYLGANAGARPGPARDRRRPRARDGRGCAGQVSSGAERPSLPLRVRGHPQARGVSRERGASV